MKVLVISHNCFSTTQNMGKTLSTLFCEFGKDEIMQLYLYPSLPNIKKFDNYYRITDKDVIHSIVKRKKCGRKILCSEINEENKLFENSNEAKTYGDIKQNRDIIRRLRDLLWKFGNWKSNDLKQWLNTEKPDVIFYALGDATFSQNIAMWISKYLNIPIVTYVCDEFYFSNKKKSLLSRIVNYSLLKNISKVQAHTVHNITICDSLGEVYKEKFSTPYTTIMTGSSFEPEERKISTGNKISYIGNLGLKRWKSLLDISYAIEELNKENGWNYHLTYYGSKNENLEEKIKYGGYLNFEQVKNVMRESILLVHTETFDKEYNDRLRYSISTKIADSLAVGTPLLAYGPENLASMQHLIKNNCAICVTEKSELKDSLLKFLVDAQELRRNVKNALVTSKKYHDSIENSNRLYTVFISVLK